MRILRRFAMLCVLGWWLGGLTFYTLTVIRAARQVTGSHAKVGLITRKATTAVNLIGAGALALMLWDAASSWRPARRRIRVGLAASWSAAALAHAWLFILHARLDRMMDAGTPDPVSFRAVHEVYLIGTTLEWFGALAFLLLALMAWKDADAALSPGRT